MSALDDHIRRETYQAISDGNPLRVSELFAAYPQLLQPQNLGPCLHDAVTEGHLPVVEQLVAFGADVNFRRNALDSAPLDLAAAGGYLEIMSYLIDRGAKLDVSSRRANPIFDAIYEGQLESVRLLIEAGLDPHVVYRGESGQLFNALKFAMHFEQTEIADQLLAAGCRMPVEGVDVPINELGLVLQTEGAADAAREQIIGRIRDELGPVDELSLQGIVPVHDEVHVAINVVRPHARSPMLTLFTTGMSDRALTVPAGQEAFQYAELVMHLPPDWPLDFKNEDAAWPLQWLRQVAYYPHQANTWLGGVHTIISSDDPPAPLGPNTKRSCLLLLADFAAWSPLTLNDGRSIKFYTVIPIYTEERDFEVQHGMQALLDRFQEEQISPVVDPHRTNVAQR